MTVRLTWVDNNADETGHQIYRSTSPMDPAALPAPIATLAADVTTYDDTTAPADTDCYYRVAAVRNGELAVSSESMINTGTGDVVETDLYWDKVSSLLHFNEIAYGTYVDDTGYGWASLGSLPSVDTTLKLFGDGSGKLAAGSFFESASMPITSGEDFCVETFYYSVNNSGYKGMLSILDGSNSIDYIYLNNNRLVSNRCGLDVSIEIDTWHHIAMVRSSGVLTIYLNGIVQGTPQAHSQTYLNGMRVRFGSDSTVTGPNTAPPGNYDEFRVTVGNPRYVSSFVPPNSELIGGQPHVNPSVDELWHLVDSLIHFNSIGAGAFVDELGYGWDHFVTSASVDSSLTLFGDGSGNFGPGFYMVRTTKPLVAGEDYCLEFFFYKDGAVGGYNGLVFLFDGSTLTKMLYTNGNDLNGEVSAQLIVNDWNHVSMTRKSGKLRVTVNGRLYQAGDDNNTYSSGMTIRLGSNKAVTGGDTTLGGRIEDFRLTLGDARYHDTFAPSRLPFTVG